MTMIRDRTAGGPRSVLGRAWLATSALALTAGMGLAETNCVLVDGVMPPDCVYPNAGLVVVMPTGENEELQGDNETTVVPPEGFLITIDGTPAIGDRRLVDVARRTDMALAGADIQVRFDGLGAVPRLDVQTLGGERFSPGDRVTFQSRLNYPAYVTRGEIRVIDPAARGGPRTLAVLPIEPNGQATMVLPQVDGLIYVHRVYDAQGRFDETAAIELDRRDVRGLSASEEEGSDNTAVRNIPVHGGALTVSGADLAPGAQVTTLGQVVRPDSDGTFVLQRILPPGEYGIDVTVRGGGQDTSFRRDLVIPDADWFAIGIADLTFGKRIGNSADSADDTYARGRLGFYAKGIVRGGYEITASADTGDEEIADMFRSLDSKDPKSLLRRIDQDQYYPTYGDDSTAEDDAPTSGKFYLRVEKDDNLFLWGNFKAALTGAEYLRNERTLYGAQLILQSRARTANGDARLRLDAYGAQPDNLPQRDVFRGTGGSVYFLQKQDLSLGSETITVEIRDSVSGRVLDRQVLVYGTDYDINYVQGIVTLTRPLSGFAGGGQVITENPGGDETVNLVVQYEYTPVATDVEGFSYGARAEAWLTDNLRIGATGMIEQTGTTDQTAAGVDLRYQAGENTWAELEYAQTEGPGFGFSESTDGGLIIDNTPGTGGNGQAVRFAAQADFADLGLKSDGLIGAYIEDRTAGFSTLDYQVDEDERLWGIYGDFAVGPRTKLGFNVDDYQSATGKRTRELGAELNYKASERVSYDIGVEQVDKSDPASAADSGSRTDLGLRVTVVQNERLTWYGFGQMTVESAGGLGENNRLGFGADIQINDFWSIAGEISDGTTGIGGRLLLTQEDGQGNSLYFGYELDPDRELNAVTLAGADKGRFTFGGKRKLNNDLTAFAENAYDLFGTHRTLTSSYGVEYGASDFASYSIAFELGRIDDPVNGDFDRKALSFGAQFSDDRGLTAKSRLELRRERGVTGGTNRNADTILLASSLKYEFSEDERIIASFEASHTETDESVLLNGDYVDASFGYAFRPTRNDKLNVLARYNFLYDTYGQQIDGVAGAGPRQRSHVVSIDASYDIDPQWTIGGKIGARFGATAETAADPFVRNDAWLAVANVRYHLVHEWDALLEVRALGAIQAQTTDFGVLAAAYRHIGNNLQVGVGYNFGNFSDDLTDLTRDDGGLFLNVIAKF